MKKIKNKITALLLAIVMCFCMVSLAGCDIGANDVIRFLPDWEEGDNTISYLMRKFQDYSAPLIDYLGDFLKKEIEGNGMGLLDTFLNPQMIESVMANIKADDAKRELLLDGVRDILLGDEASTTFEGLLSDEAIMELIEKNLLLDDENGNNAFRDALSEAIMAKLMEEGEGSFTDQILNAVQDRLLNDDEDDGFKQQFIDALLDAPEGQSAPLVEALSQDPNFMASLATNDDFLEAMMSNPAFFEAMSESPRFNYMIDKKIYEMINPGDLPYMSYEQYVALQYPNP